MNEGTVSSRAARPVARIGCSGWNYRHWREAFYPAGLPASRWFDFYAEHFDTVELNNSFYRLPANQTFDKWRDQAPDGFCFAVKANRFITQAKKLLDCEDPVARQTKAFRHLGDHLGPILYQLPPRLKIDPERLESFLALLPDDCVNVFEFRDPSWYVPEVFALLERYGASLCIHDMAESAANRLVVGPVAYVRFHGAGGKYYGRYTEDVLRSWAEWIGSQLEEARSVWAYFNNDINADAIADALTLRRLVGSGAVPGQRPANPPLAPD